MVTERYNKANGYQEDSDIIYGNTDSVMVIFGVPSTQRATMMTCMLQEDGDGALQQGQRVRGGQRCHLWRHRLRHGHLRGALHTARHNDDLHAAGRW